MLSDIEISAPELITMATTSFTKIECKWKAIDLSYSNEPFCPFKSGKIIISNENPQFKTRFTIMADKGVLGETTKEIEESSKAIFKVFLKTYPEFIVVSQAINPDEDDCEVRIGIPYRFINKRSDNS